jgi:murein DD-endopeptidase MepM/ murein hydrolase activator NlpD
VTRDYKFGPRPARGGGRLLRRTLMAGATIGLVVAGVRFLDAGVTPATPNGTAPGSLTIPLPLPAPAGRDDAESPADATGSPSLLDTPPAAPSRSLDAPPARTAAGEDTPHTEAATTVTTAPTAADATVADVPAPAPVTNAAAGPPAPLAGQIAPAGALAADRTTPAAADEPTAERWLEHRVAKGESLARIFDRHGLDARVLHGIVNSSREAKSLGSIRPGQTLRLLIGDGDELQRLELQRSRVETLRVSLADDGYAVEQVQRDVEKRVAAAAGVIESSLFVDGQKAGLSDGVIMELAAVFGWDIDFALEIRAGDEFRVLYEEHFVDGEKLRDGPILAAEFTNRGTTHTAVRYENRGGEVAYYDANGHGKRRAFIRTPIKFARISSRYNPKRWHPVLKRWRSHKGVDYAAPTGTPVKATGDGRVAFRGTKGGYGRTVILEHAGKYTTLYAHLSRYSKRAKTGQRVKQGQVIGYVGQTGLATGPHLHYEFRINGNHKDPLRVKLPKTLPLPKSEIGRFRDATAPLLARLESIPAETLIASVDTEKTN